MNGVLLRPGQVTLAELRALWAGAAAALEVPQSERGQLIARLSAGDSTVHREIHSLVDAAIKASNFTFTSLSDAV